jgi:hypothetical protein
LQTPEGVVLANLLNYSHAPRTELSNLLLVWSIPGMATTFAGAYAGHDLTVDMQVWIGVPASTPELTISPGQKTTIMEHFNGAPTKPSPAPIPSPSLSAPSPVSPANLLRCTEAIRHDSLLVQTRLKPYLDDISLSLIQYCLDFTALTIDKPAYTTPMLPLPWATCSICAA